jgi:hypothetical protein
VPNSVREKENFSDPNAEREAEKTRKAARLERGTFRLSRVWGRVRVGGKEWFMGEMVNAFFLGGALKGLI